MKDPWSSRLSIGQAAEFTGLSVRQVRHYCTKGLVDPIEIDAINGYRYFDFHGVSRLFFIKEMLFHGFSLEQIRVSLIDGEGGILKLLETRQKNIQKEIRVLNQKNRALSNYIDKIKNFTLDSNIHFDITELPGRKVFLKKIEMTKLDGLQFSSGYKQVKRIAANNHSSETLIVGYNGFSKATPLDGTFILESLNGDEELPPGRYARMLFKGEYEDLYSKGIPLFEKWITEKNLTIDTMIYEIYHLTRPIVEVGNRYSY